MANGKRVRYDRVFAGTFMADVMIGLKLGREAVDIEFEIEPNETVLGPMSDFEIALLYAAKKCSERRDKLMDDNGLVRQSIGKGISMAIGSVNPGNKEIWDQVTDFHSESEFIFQILWHQISKRFNDHTNLGIRTGCIIVKQPEKSELGAEAFGKELLRGLQEAQLGGDLDDIEREILETVFGEFPAKGSASMIISRGERHSCRTCNPETYKKCDLPFKESRF